MRRWDTWRLMVLAMALAGCVTLAGCSSRFTRPNYETILRGMGPAEVRERIGDPDRIGGTTWRYLRDRPYRQAVIEFQAGKVQAKHWYYQPPTGTDGSPGSEKRE